MNKNTFYTLLLFFILVCGANAQEASSKEIVKTILSPSRKSSPITVVAHRGDWRHFPENSLKGIESAIKKGIDVIEIDLAMTSDSVLVLMHDRTVDRTTNGKGRVDSYTLDSIRTLRLKNGWGGLSHYGIPTLEEVLHMVKGRVVINIDKGFDYFPQVYALTEKTGTTSQIIIKSGYPYKKVKTVLDTQTGGKMIYMPIINILKDGQEEMLDEYLKNMPCAAYEIVFPSLTPKVQETYDKIISSGGRVWVNTLWNSLCAGMTDDAAADDRNIYDQHLEMGATIIQTDRPEMLIQHLKSKKLHR